MAEEKDLPSGPPQEETQPSVSSTEDVLRSETPNDGIGEKAFPLEERKLIVWRHSFDVAPVKKRFLWRRGN